MRALLPKSKIAAFLFCFVVLCAGMVGWFLEDIFATSSIHQREVLSIYNASDFKEEVERAADSWNKANIGKKFTMTDSPMQADIFIISDNTPMDNCNIPTATDGPLISCAALTLTRVPSPQFVILEEKNKYSKAQAIIQVTVHELGHILELDHREGCSAMNPSISVMADECENTPKDKGEICGPRLVDIEAARKQWGGHGDFRITYCPSKIEFFTF